MRSIVCVVAAVAWLGGCNGPTKVGKEMREQAYSRMDAVNARLVHEQAMSAFETGQLEDARLLLSEAIARFPGQASWHSLMGRILLEQHRLDAARASFEEALSLDPELSESAYYLGVLHERWSEDAIAASYFQQAWSLDQDRPQYLLAAAEALMASGELDRARNLLESKMEYFEHHAGLRHLLAHVAMRSGDHVEAASHCEAARLLVPDDKALSTDLALMRFGAGDWSGCLDAVADVRLRWGEAPPVLLRCEARALMALGRSVEARAVVRDLCTASPNDAGLWREFGLLGWEVGDWSTVAEAASRLKGLDAFPWEQGLFEGLTLRQGGDHAAAERHLTELTKTFPDHPETWAVLASVRMKRGDFKGSRSARDMALKWASDRSDPSTVSGVYGTHGP